VRGLGQMIENDRYSVDMVQQTELHPFSTGQGGIADKA
jgi:hypothetical protein